MARSNLSAARKLKPKTGHPQPARLHDDQAQDPALLKSRLLNSFHRQLEQALAHEAAGDTPRADAAFSDALGMVDTTPLQQLIMRHGAVLQPLLKRATEQGAPVSATQMLSQSLAHARTVDHRGDSNDALSVREAELLQLVADGLRNKDIAAQLCISISTVKAHLYNIFSKLHARNRTEAVSLGRGLGFIQ